MARSPARYNAVWAYLMLLPFLIGLVVFIVGPLFFAVFLSFTDWNILGWPRWVGLLNYSELLADPVFWKAFWNTIYYTLITVPVTIVISLGLATLMNRPIRGVFVLRAIYFSPITVSVIAVGLLWSWLYTPNYGFLNYVLRFLGIQPISWLVSAQTALLSLMIVGIWRGLGFNIVVMLAGLKSIPQEMYDASAIDGANEIQQFRHVTLPMLTPTLFFAVVMAFISSFQVFELTYIMTQGGPSNSTTTLIYNTYLQGFTFLRMGYASAISVVFLAVVLIVTIWQIKFQEKWVHYDE
ncbi:MAG: sugar ABC transporter permease [Caldilineaceae bacterium]|nr:sugar ABC transporter permease [Caldilineaceae bacterium]